MPNIANKALWGDASLNWKETQIQVAITQAVKRHDCYVVTSPINGIDAALSKIVKLKLDGNTAFTYAADQNAGLRGPKAQADAKAAGMEPGELDMRFYISGGNILLIELKTPKNKITHKCNKHQLDRIALLEKLGFTCYTVTARCPQDGVKQVIDILNKELNYG